MSKHTPGPWSVLDNPDGLPIITGPKLATIAHVRAPIDATGEEIDANARLMAAAPQMLEALRDLALFAGYVPPLQAFADYEHPRRTGLVAALTKALAAIKKGTP